ncbi:MAG: hypothetical protein OWU84_01130 [Firmicutes bacterium]|nr:hypothetical protein [Bacillota bacterium]
MTRWPRIVTLTVILLGLITGCGAAPLPPRSLPDVSRHAAGLTIRLQWLTTPTELKSSTFRLVLAPPPATVHLRGTLTMTEMSMPPVSATWQQVHPGVWKGEVIPTMAGSWRLALVIRTPRRTWHETYLINVTN